MCRWLTPVILATQKTEIRRTEVGKQPRQIVYETLSGKNITKSAGGVAQDVGPEFKSPCCQKKKKKLFS
jgi:hypothetical protein